MARALPLVLCLVGCGSHPGDSAETRGIPPACDDGAALDTYAAGLQKITADGAYTVTLVDALPAPPDVGPNTLTVSVDAPPGAEVKLRPWMPLHGHGTVPEWHPAQPDGDRWVFADVDLFMAGLWELAFTVDSDDPGTGALFRFCLEG